MKKTFSFAIILMIIFTACGKPVEPDKISQINEIDTGPINLAYQELDNLESFFNAPVNFDFTNALLSDSNKNSYASIINGKVSMTSGWHMVGLPSSMFAKDGFFRLKNKKDPKLKNIKKLYLFWQNEWQVFPSSKYKDLNEYADKVVSSHYGNNLVTVWVKVGQEANMELEISTNTENNDNISINAKGWHMITLPRTVLATKGDKFVTDLGIQDAYFYLENTKSNEKPWLQFSTFSDKEKTFTEKVLEYEKSDYIALMVRKFITEENKDQFSPLPIFDKLNKTSVKFKAGNIGSDVKNKIEQVLTKWEDEEDSPNVKVAKEYLQYYDKIKPSEINVQYNRRKNLAIYQLNKSLQNNLDTYLTKNLNEVEISSLEYAETNKMYSVYSNDTEYSKQWDVKSIFDNASNIDKLLDGKFTGTKKIVAVIDTGTNFAHEDLANMKWKPTGNKCVDENGANISTGCPNGGYDIIDKDNDPTPASTAFHGTATAGCVGTETNNSKGLAGVSNNSVEIMALKISNGDSMTNDDIVNAIKFAINNKADVMNMSFGGYSYDQSTYDAIDAAEKAGILVVTAAGNDGVDDLVYPSIPGGFGTTRATATTFYYYGYTVVIPAFTGLDNIINVGATDSAGALASFSNYSSSSVHIAAPGDNIYTTDLSPSYDTTSGTSFSSPYTAGVAARYWAENPSFKDYKEVKEKVLSSAKVNSALSSTINGGKALRYVAETDDEDDEEDEGDDEDDEDGDDDEDGEDDEDDEDEDEDDEEGTGNCTIETATTPTYKHKLKVDTTKCNGEKQDNMICTEGAYINKAGEYCTKDNEYIDNTEAATERDIACFCKEKDQTRLCGDTQQKTLRTDWTCNENGYIAKIDDDNSPWCTKDHKYMPTLKEAYKNKLYCYPFTGTWQTITVDENNYNKEIFTWTNDDSYDFFSLDLDIKIEGSKNYLFDTYFYKHAGILKKSTKADLTQFSIYPDGAKLTCLKASGDKQDYVWRLFGIKDSDKDGIANCSAGKDDCKVIAVGSLKLTKDLTISGDKITLGTGGGDTEDEETITFNKDNVSEKKFDWSDKKGEYEAFSLDIFDKDGKNLYFKPSGVLKSSTSTNLLSLQKYLTEEKITKIEAGTYQWQSIGLTKANDDGSAKSDNKSEPIGEKITFKVEGTLAFKADGSFDEANSTAPSDEDSDENSGKKNPATPACTLGTACWVDTNSYYYQLPNNYAEDKAMGLIITLHGQAGDATTAKSQANVLLQQNLAITKNDFIFVAPQGSTTGGSWDLESDKTRIKAIVADFKSKYNVSKVFLDGFSAGAKVVQYMFSESEFNAFVSVEGLAYTSDVNCSSFSYKSNYVNDPYNKTVPIYVFYGTSSAGASKCLVDELTEGGYNATLKSFSGSHERSPAVADLIKFFQEQNK